MEKTGNIARHAAVAALCAFGIASSASAFAEAKSITVEDAVKLALSSDGRVESSYWDLAAAQDKVDEAKRRLLPQASLSGSYTRLSDLQSEINFGGMSIPMDSLDNAFSLAANVQYPVFAGYRLRESVTLAELQKQGKDVSSEMTRRAVAFETQRAYWEAVRATNNVRMLAENLALARKTRDLTDKQVQSGVAMNADLLAADMRRDQAELDLSSATTAQRRAFLSLAALVGPGPDLPEDAVASLTLASRPEEPAECAGEGGPLSGSLDTASLVSRAIANRPETKGAAIATEAAEVGKKIAEAPLYPSLNVSGNYTYADPNNRVAFQSDPWKFTGTWSLTASISYDLGSVPANLASRDAQEDGARKGQADARRQGTTVALDVRNCAMAFDQARDDLSRVSRMLSQAEENERVTAQRVKVGTASETDLLSAQFSRLKAELAISNKRIDLQIAAADLCRAAALTDAR